ncbi:MAG: hypothetical protein ACYC3L_05795 [Gemmatimonadaceae bacterium]
MTQSAHATDSSGPSTRSFAPWLLLAVLLVAGIVCFFLFADRVPSLLQALSEK